VTCNDVEQAKDSFKCRTALNYKIPVVSFDFLNECVKEACWVDPEPFFVVGETKSQLLHRGLISSCSKFCVCCHYYCNTRQYNKGNPILQQASKHCRLWFQKQSIAKRVFDKGVGHSLYSSQIALLMKIIDMTCCFLVHLI